MAEVRDLVVIGASAGGLEPLKAVLSAFPPSTSAAVLVVLHTGRSGESRLGDVLRDAGALPAAFAQDQDPLRAGTVVVAPADRHLALQDSRVRVLSGPEENGQRPAIDVLFRSAAQTFGRRVIGVVLSGSLDDGAAGLRAIKQAGGVTIVQSPEDADFSGMPDAAIREGAADYVLPTSMMPRTLLRLMRDGEHGAGPAHQGPSSTPAAGGPPAPLAEQEPTKPPESVLACPTCGGVLWEISESGMLRYRCHVGHVFSPEAMVEEHGRTVEQALWTALRMIRERIAVLRRMTRYATEQGMTPLAARYTAQAAEAERTAEVMRELLFPT